MKLRWMAGLVVLTAMVSTVARADGFATTTDGGCIGYGLGECHWSGTATPEGDVALAVEIRSLLETVPGQGFGFTFAELATEFEYAGPPVPEVPIAVTMHVEHAEVRHTGVLHELFGPADADFDTAVELAASVDGRECPDCGVARYCSTETCSVVGLFEGPVQRHSEDMTFDLALKNADQELVPAGSYKLHLQLIAWVEQQRDTVPDNGVVSASFDGSVTAISIG